MHSLPSKSAGLRLAALPLTLYVHLFGATISAKTYGAVGDGVGNDTAAIQKASDACSGGSTLLFPAGNYRVTRPLTAHSGCSYVGAVGAAITGYTGTGAGGFPLFQTDASSSNITFSGLTMNGGGINLAGSGWADHITITNNVIQNIVNSNSGYGAFLSSIYCSGWGMQNTTIRGNTFQDQFLGGNNNLKEPDDPTTAILCRRVNVVTITDNTFDNLNEGIHILEAHDPGTYNRLQIQRNKFTRIHRMPIEIQTWYLTNIVIEDNSMTNYLNPFWNSFGISFAAGVGANAATGAIIRRNFIALDKLAVGINSSAAGYCMEVWANGTVVDSNVCESIGQGTWSSAVAIGPWTQNAMISNNTFCGPFTSDRAFEASASQVGTATFTNNTIVANCNGVVH